MALPNFSLAVLGRLGIAVLLLGSVWACNRPLIQVPDPGPEPIGLGDRFNVDETGKLTGRVVWDGPLPDLEKYRQLPGTHRANPRLPKISEDRGIGGILVAVKGIDSSRSKPWDWPEPRVLISQEGLGIEPYGVQTIGVVRNHTTVELVSEEAGYVMLRGRGANSFTFPFLEQGQTIRKKLNHAGWVELSSGSELYWHSAWLYVSEDPYLAITDADGRFKIEEIPNGEYQLSAWMPAWEWTAVERNPESGLIRRIRYAPMVKKSENVTVRAEQSADRELRFQLANFNIDP